MILGLHLDDSIDISYIARKEKDNDVEWESLSISSEIRNTSVLSDQNGEAIAADLDNNGPIWTVESFAYKYSPEEVCQ